MKKEKINIKGERRGIKEDVETTRAVEFVISTSAKDRHGTVLNMSNWDLTAYNVNGIVAYQHDTSFSNPDLILGKGEAWMEEGKLIGRVTFEPKEINPLAEKVFRKVLHGTLSAASVGFIPTGAGSYGKGEEARGGENETYYFEGQELLEWSIVNIPSNSEAIKRTGNIYNIAAKAGEKVKLKTFEDVKRGENLGTFLKDLISIKVQEEAGTEEEIKEVMAEAAKIELSTLNQILSGEINCPPLERLQSFAEVLEVEAESLMEQALKDGCKYEEKNSNKNSFALRKRVINIFKLKQ